MMILRLLSAASAAVLAVSTLSAQEAVPATEPAKVEAAAAAAAVETIAAEVSRPLPKVHQGTPFTGDRGRMITFSILFFLLSVFMGGLLLRTKEDVPT